jgi:hypothetical protein
LVPIVSQLVARLVTFLHPPLMTSLATSLCDQAMVTPGLPRPTVASVESLMLVEPTSEARKESAPRMLGADGTLQGAAYV